MDAVRRLIAVSDHYVEPSGQRPGGQSLPQLPALCELLRLGVPGRASGSRHQDWRAGLAADLDAAALADVAPAQVARCAVAGLTPDSSVCFAEPVHLVAGMSSVHLHPAGLISLDATLSAELRLAFEREFGATHQHLHGAGAGLLLESPVAAVARAPDPARLLGSPMESLRTQDAAQRELRRLGVEVEMWLGGLPLNRSRERRGELPVTALWFWGGGVGELPEVDPAGANRWQQAYGADPWLHGCWRKLAGREVQPATHWDQVPAQWALIVVSAARASLSQLESDWFAPALRDLRNGRVASLSLRIGGRCWEIGSSLRSRWWRRSRPWWEVLVA